MGKRFNLGISLDIKEVKDGGKETDFMESTLNYSDLPMEGMLMIEGMLIELMQKLNEIGIVQADAKGEELSMLRIKDGCK